MTLKLYMDESCGSINKEKSTAVRFHFGSDWRFWIADTMTSNLPTSSRADKMINEDALTRLNLIGREDPCSVLDDSRGFAWDRTACLFAKLTGSTLGKFTVRQVCCSSVQTSHAF